MKKAVSKILVSLLVVMFPAFLSGQKADFSGTWKIDTSKIPVTGNFPVLTKITISIKGDSLLTERFYNTGDGQEYPFSENLTLDGKENTITIYDMPRKAKATWKEKDIVLIHEAITTAYGSNGPVDFLSTETWSVDNITNILTISFINKTMSGESTGSFIFNKSVVAN
jgi:hypothetical protein